MSTEEEKQEELNRKKAIGSFKPGSIIVERYKVLQFISSGGFGFVLRYF